MNPTLVSRRDALKLALGAGVVGLLGGCQRLPSAPTSDDDCIRAAQQLVSRLLPKQADAFAFQCIPATDGLDVFEITSDGGQVLIGGNTAGVMAVGLNHYLRNYCGAAVSVNYRQLNLPTRLPSVDGRVRVVSPDHYRYLFNYCTFGYSMPWWDWSRWEYMIDTMAMQGVNMPLAPIGQEAVWQQVYGDMGLSRQELEAFFVGPAHLPWGRMGNIDGLGGPLPQGWIDQRRELQQKILTRMRALGMKPVLQGFTGHVPPTLKDRYPDAAITQIGDWAGIPGTRFLDPTDPLFMEIGQRFIKTQTDFYGTDHLYDADCFIEVDPPSSDPKYLSALSRGVYESMVAADPDAVWVMQGWFFFFRKDFWQPEQGRAFVGGVPDDRMIVLDLYGERNPTWKDTESFYGKRWIWNVICNQDQRVNMSGNLAQMQANLSEARRATGQLSGIGVIPEGVGYNPVVHEFIFEKAWQPEDVDLDQWIRAFATRRYGQPNQAAHGAWEKLLDTVYGRSRTMSSPLITTPRLMKVAGAADDDPFGWDFDVPQLAEAARLLLSAAKALKGNEAYRFDLVNVHRELLHAFSHRFIYGLSSAFAQRDPAALDQAGTRLIELLEDLETVCGSHGQFLLGRWIADARRWGATPGEADYYERNARTIVSIWQPWKDGGLRDYAAKTWNGMFSGYYQPRWELLIGHLKRSLADDTSFDPSAYDRAVREIDFQWTLSTEAYPTQPTSDAVDTARSMSEKYASFLRIPPTPSWPVIS